MDLVSLPAVPGAHKRRKRVGRGIGSGHGKTSTRGQKGQRARTGSGKRPGFEGSRTPMIRRLPKRGFRRKAQGWEPQHEAFNVDRLNQFADGQRVTPDVLAQHGVVKHAANRLKLLGDGELTKRVTVVVHAASASAKEKVTKAGGAVELLVSAPPAAAA